MKKYFVYILASRPKGTIYVGSTSNIVQRIWQHKNHIISGFPSKYSALNLVYYEEHINLVEMVRRERRIKNWHRQWKLNLIEDFNPRWQDLFFEIAS